MKQERICSDLSESGDLCYETKLKPTFARITNKLGFIPLADQLCPDYITDFTAMIIGSAVFAAITRSIPSPFLFSGHVMPKHHCGCSLRYKTREVGPFSFWEIINANGGEGTAWP
jgi:hypothetical protein